MGDECSLFDNGVMDDVTNAATLLALPSHHCTNTTSTIGDELTTIIASRWACGSIPASRIHHDTNFSGGGVFLRSPSTASLPLQTW